MQAELTSVQKREHAAFDKALKRFEAAIPHFNNTELEVLKDKPIMLGDLLNETDENPSRVSVTASLDESGSIVFEMNELVMTMLDHPTLPNKGFVGRKAKTYSLAWNEKEGKVKSVKSGQNFENVSQDTIIALFDFEIPVKPVRNMSTVENLTQKTEILNTVADLMPELYLPAKLG